MAAAQEPFGHGAEAGVDTRRQCRRNRAARHDTIVDGRPRERFVLSDWDDRGHYLEIDERGARTREITG